MTVSVMRVLFVPMNNPATMMQTISTVELCVKAAITARSTANRVSARAMPLTVPIARWRRGARNTDEIATHTPQPQKIRPILIAPWIGWSASPNGNGA